jgi:hypothetical protein
MPDPTAIEQRDEALPEQREEAVATALLSGRSVNQVRKEFGLSIDEIDAIIARTWPVDQRARVRMIMTDLGKLDRLISEFHQRSLASQDATAAAFASVAIKAMERKHDICGMSAATRIDLQVTTAPNAPTQYQRITEALLSLKYGSTGRPNGDGAAPLDHPVPPADDADPNR